MLRKLISVSILMRFLITLKKMLVRIGNQLLKKILRLIKLFQ